MRERNLVSAGGTDDDFSALGGHTDFTTRETVLSEFTLKEFSQFSVHKSVSHELCK